MPERPVTNLSATAFSIARQLTGPPFSVTLESTDLRQRLLEELAHPAGEKLVKVRKPKAKARSRKAGKPAAKRRSKKSRK